MSPPPKRPLAHDSRILLALACLPFLPVAPSNQSQCQREAECSLFGIPLHRSAAWKYLTDSHVATAGRNAGSRLAIGTLVFGGKDQGSFGCSVNLPLGSRSVDPHSTAVWCGNLLHSSPQPHTAECSTLHSMEYSLLQPRSALGDAQAGSTPSRIRSHSCPFYTTMLCLGCHIAGRL